MLPLFKKIKDIQDFCEQNPGYEYVITEIGPADDPTFEIQVLLRRKGDTVSASFTSKRNQKEIQK